MKNLVIVESPTKAKTIGKFLGKDYTIKSSYGHVRDLPKSTMGIDFDNNFEPQYIIPTKAKKTVTELKKIAAKADAIYFATDQDREGEAISWHLQQLLDVPDAQVKRITFHEITKKAIMEALEHPKKINADLVDAQQARRVLDRLVGYELSPLLWKKVARGLSAGRVQSVAVRLIVDREAEITAFKPVEYWTVDGTAEKGGKTFAVSLAQIDGTKLSKFDLTKEEAEKAQADLAGAKLTVTDVTSKKVSKTPPPPYTTSTLQIDANRHLGFSTKQTMVLAQQLYEGIALGDKDQTGLITYMRTDSVNLADEFVTAAQAYAGSEFGQEYVVSGGRRYKSKSKNAQEAHEAVRPTDVTNTPETVAEHLDSRQRKLYELIWRRALASQLPNSESEATAVTLEPDGKPYLLKATGSVVTFDGWQRILKVRKGDEPELPKLATGDKATLTKIDALQHFTQPPARYSEASLVKALEERGIGRPSTYAPTIATIVERGYVDKNREDRRLHPTEIGTLVNELLVEHFPDIVDYDFTAGLEEDLDKIAAGEKEWQPIIKKFYVPFKKNITQKEQELNKKDITEEATDEVCDKCGKPMVVKIGRYGKFLACTGYPDCKNTKQINGKNEIEQSKTIDEVCDKCGKPMVEKMGRYGKFIACSGYPDCKNIKRSVITTGVACPQCDKGEIIQKRSKRGRIFFSCNQYPACVFALWQKPTGEKCPTCGSLLTEDLKGAIKCSNKECAYRPEK
ncbi:MAG: DNA topoisomerase I [Candidatus Komeilibacteria bacterium RIFCSPLOWO2_01_FULL_53_11]|uniref:DNA topoisomerase 1 n=1 Tax=Candidatus Komeilibacteria bacterium RIFCSPLOWO2_01_FULL_53_11 TaxID=1798552 RepID=A0A1G2BXY5_9BACT|nr:MAG: DNA topoisomerase I [Candidatus Komeilibacteria bacterium RIFCSPLOWO2_01_FULL_53_11]